MEDDLVRLAPPSEMVDALAALLKPTRGVKTRCSCGEPMGVERAGYKIRLVCHECFFRLEVGDIEDVAHALAVLATRRFVERPKCGTCKWLEGGMAKWLDDGRQAGVDVTFVCPYDAVHLRRCATSDCCPTHQDADGWVGQEPK